jgi:type I restriction enzyme S subunit
MTTELTVREAPARYVVEAQAATPKGYKQTEVGVMPEDWIGRTLESMSAFITKGSTPTTYGYKWEQSGILFLRSECVSEKGLDLTQSMFISPAAHASLQRSEVCDGDILVTITGNVGRAVYLENIGHANLNQHIARVRIKSDQAESKYVYHYLSQPSVRRHFNTITTGQAYPQISLKQVRDAVISLPPTKAEQEAIAEALSDADALIASLERLIAKKRQLKHGAMQELLTGRKRLPGFGGEWEVKILGEVAPLQRGYDLPTPQLKAGPYPVVYSNGVLNHHAAFQVKGPGVVTGRSGTIGKVSFVEQDYWPHNTSLWVTSFKGNDPKFVFYLFTRIGFERFATGSGVPTLNRNDVHAFKVTMPPTKEEQTAIASILFDMDAEIAALEARLAKAHEVKQGMMQELLTGRIRLV